VRPQFPHRNSDDTPSSRGLQGPRKTAIDANNRFALDLYALLAGDPEYGKGNILFSPYLISTTFGVTYKGAKGQTADEICKVFHFPENQSTMRFGFEEIVGEVNSHSNVHSQKTAKAPWAEKTHPSQPDYSRVADKSNMA
jgi:serpin B